MMLSQDTMVKSGESFMNYVCVENLILVHDSGHSLLDCSVSCSFLLISSGLWSLHW